MKKNKLVFSLVLFCGFLSYQKGYAQLNLSGRSSALSGNIVNLDDEFSLMQNPAGTAQLNNCSLGITFENNYLSKVLSRQLIVAVLPTKKYGVPSFGYSQFGYHLYQERDLFFGWSRAFSEKFSMGMNLQYSGIKLGDDLGKSVILKITTGMQIKLTPSLQLGVIVNNPLRPVISSYNKERSAASFFTGLKYQFSKKVITYVQADQYSERNPTLRVAMEYIPIENFFLRGGLLISPFSESFGFGFILHSFKIDLASSYHPQLGFSPTFSMVYNFNNHDK